MSSHYGSTRTQRQICRRLRLADKIVGTSRQSCPSRPGIDEIVDGKTHTPVSLSGEYNKPVGFTEPVPGHRQMARFSIFPRKTACPAPAAAVVMLGADLDYEAHINSLVHVSFFKGVR
jgi:hypothetical protein